MLVYFTLVPLSPNALSQVDDSKTPFHFSSPKRNVILSPHLG